MPPLATSNASSLFFLRVNASVELGQLDRIQQICNLCFRQSLLLSNDFKNALTAFVGFIRNLCSLVVSNNRVESGDYSDRGLHVTSQHLLVDLDSVDALGSERFGGVVEQILGFHH